MTCKVRRFEDRDAEAVSRIMFESFQTFLGDLMKDEKPYPPSHWISANAHNDADSEVRLFVAEEDGAVIGCISASVSKKRRLGTLNVIGVDPKTYAKGVGTLLFAAAEKFWMEYKIRKAYTCTSSINQRAQIYYLKQGFRPEGLQRDHFFQGVDEIMLAKFYPQNLTEEERNRIFQ